MINTHRKNSGYRRGKTYLLMALLLSELSCVQRSLSSLRLSFVMRLPGRVCVLRLGELEFGGGGECKTQLRQLSLTPLILITVLRHGALLAILIPNPF